MKKFLALSVLLTLSAVPAFGQVSESNSQSSGSVDLSGFRDEIANKNKALADKVKAEQMLVKKNALILDDAKKIAADNSTARPGAQATGRSECRIRAAASRLDGGSFGWLIDQ